MRKKRIRRQVEWIEALESRQLLSAAVQALTGGNSTQVQAALQFKPTYEASAAGMLSPLQTAGPQGYTPSEIRTAYGLNQIFFQGATAGTGAGQTIAIIDAYNDPNIRTDLHAFDVAFGLTDPTLTVVGQNGGAVPRVDPVGPGGANFEGEEALDVEWAHALAPGANILLVEANDASPSNLFAAVNFARNVAGVSVISMSFGGNEAGSETQYDSFFTTPSGHQGVTFIASTGDSGTPAGFPSYSPNVLATGGTSLSINSVGNYQSEIGWNGSGGGISTVEAQPSYQNGVVTQSHTLRTNPDVAFDADPRTGVAVYDSYNNGTSTPWEILGGTSVAAPAWAGIMAVVNQGRVLAGEGTLDGRTGTLPLIYAAPAGDFHDITSGNNGLPAAAGYDLVTGRGSPVANLLVPFLVNGNVTPPPPVTGPVIASVSASSSTVVEGAPLTLTANGVSDPGGTGLTVTFYEESNGIAGLQTGAGGDFAFPPVTDGSNSISLDTSNTPGAFTFYAQLTDASGAASAAGTSAPSVNVTVTVPSASSGPSIASISATPNPVASGATVTLQANGVTDSQSAVRRLTFYEETNGTPGLQTGIGGDFAFRSVTSAGGYALALDTAGVTGLVTFYAQASDFLGDQSAAGMAAPSVDVSILTDALPAATTNLQATAVSATEIDLSFTESGSDQTGFSIERALDPNFTTFTQVFSIDRPDAVTFSDTGLSPGTRYYYRVQAENAAGTSDFSNVATAMTVANQFVPVGSIDMAGPKAVFGWAIDQDTPGTSVNVQLYVDGSLYANGVANINRTDLTAVFGSSNHGYLFDISALNPGVHRLDVFAMDTSTNALAEISTTRVVNTNLSPQGFIDRFDGQTLAGWAFDPNAGGTPIQIRYTIDGGPAVLATAGGTRNDLTAVFGSANHGFSIALPQLTAGAHTVSVWAVDPTSDALVSLGTRSAVVAAAGGGVLPVGNVDAATTTRVSGWVFDADAPSTSLNVRVDVDGAAGTVFAANLLRPDVAAAFHTTGAFGFGKVLTLTPGEHRIDVYAIDQSSGTPVLIGSRMVQTAAGGVMGSIDVANGTVVAGWAWSAALGGASALVRVDVDGVAGTAVAANLSRPDVAVVVGPGNFGFRVPMVDVLPGTHTVVLWLIDPLTLTATKLVTRSVVTG